MVRASEQIRKVVAFRGNITAAEYARILKARKQPITTMQGEMI